MGFLIIFFFFISAICLIPSAYAFNVDGHNVLVLDKFVDKFSYPDPAKEWYYNMTFTQNSTDPVVVKFPNNMNVRTSLNFEVTWVVREPVFDADIDVVESWYVDTIRGACYDTHILNPNWEYSSIEVGSAMVLGDMSEPVQHKVEPFCYEIFENPPPLMDCLAPNQNHINVRGESVCVSSIESLIDRGYIV